MESHASVCLTAYDPSAFTTGSEPVGADGARVIQPEFLYLPQTLLDIPGAWCPWRALPREGKPGKLDKVPRTLDGRRNLRKGDAWFSAVEAFGAYTTGTADPGADVHGVGFSMIGQKNIVGIDLDNVVNPQTGAVADWAVEVVERFAPAYVEVSPSGRGLRLFVLGSIDADVNNHERGIEVYGGHAGRFLTVTGWTLPGSADDLQPAPEGALEWLLKTYKPVQKTKAAAAASDPSPEVPAILPADELPELAQLRITDAVRLFLTEGRPLGKADDGRPTDRSRDLLVATHGLFEAVGGDNRDQVVLSLLIRSPGSREVAMDHRRGDEGRAVDYLWQHHVRHARTTVPIADRFEVLDDGEEDADADRSVITRADFYFVAPEAKAVYLPTGAMWPTASVDALFPRASRREPKTTDWMAQHRRVEQVAWLPGEPQIVKGAYQRDGAAILDAKASVYNRYTPPATVRGNARAARRWVEHVMLVYPEGGDFLIQCCAHRLQRPGEKINFGTVMGGAPGIGKDTMLEPVKRAVGHHNWAEVSPQAMQGSFNGYMQSIVLRMSEARDPGEVDRYRFYDKLKTVTTAPPDTVRINEKHRQEFYVRNVTWLIVTTNHFDGLYLPPDDRRFHVLWSPKQKEDFAADYWVELWAWYENGGAADVAEYLRGLSLAGFNPSLAPPLTEAWHVMVAQGLSPEDADMAAVLDDMGRPDVVTPEELRSSAIASFGSELGVDTPSGRKRLPHSMGREGYMLFRNPDRRDGRWRVGPDRFIVFVRRDVASKAAAVAAHLKAREGGR